MSDNLVHIQHFEPGVIQETALAWPELDKLFRMKFLVATVSTCGGEQAFSSLMVAFGLRGLAELTRKISIVKCLPIAFYSEHDGQLIQIMNMRVNHHGGDYDYGESLRVTLSVVRDLECFAEVAAKPYGAGDYYEVKYSQEFIEMEMLYGEKESGQDGD